MYCLPCLKRIDNANIYTALSARIFAFCLKHFYGKNFHSDNGLNEHSAPYQSLSFRQTKRTELNDLSTQFFHFKI